MLDIILRKPAYAVLTLIILISGRIPIYSHSVSPPVLFGFVEGNSPGIQNRKIEFKYLHVGILKVVEVRHLSDENWLRNLEIEFKNISGKPIYFMEFDIVLPEAKPRGGDRYGMIWRYGNRALRNNDKLANPDDVPIKPDESFILKIPEIDIATFENSESRDYTITKVALEFTFINFGDGTGFIIGKPQPVRVHKDI